MKFKFLFAVIAIASVACSKNNNDNTSLNNEDNYFMQQASYANYAEINAGALASVKGNTDSVKMFGVMMVSDHGKAQSSLDSLGTKFNVTLPNTADSVHQAMYAVLQLQSGKTFDTMYMNGQVNDHIATVALFQKEIAEGNNAMVKNFATVNLPIIQMHLQDAENIRALLQ